MSSLADDPVTFTGVLPVSRETVYFLATLLHQRQRELGTRRATRALGPFRHAVLVLRWFLNATRLAQLAVDNAIALSTAYTRLHEGIDVLAALAPDVHEALLAAKAAGAMCFRNRWFGDVDCLSFSAGPCNPPGDEAINRMTPEVQR